MIAGEGPRDCIAPREAPPLLELVGLDIRVGAAHALRGAHLTAHAGELVGLCGDSGAGKSTLVKILAGVHAHGSFRGQIVLDGVPRRFSSPADARAAGIAIVHQRTTLVPQLTVAENLMLGHEPRRFGLVDEARLVAQARDRIARFGFADQLRPTALAEDLDAGLAQIVEIIRALSRDARLVVLDEPAAHLLPRERDRLAEWLRTLRRHGATCLYVAHRLDEVIGLCDRITVLRDGVTAQTLTGASPGHRPVAGRYLVHDEIAAGGMATVHLGKIRGPFGFTSTVAIKRLHPLLARDAEFVAMFLDEARLASRVRHPNVVPVLDVIAEDGELSLVMEYVEGESLGQLARLASGTGASVPVPIAIAIVAAILHGLQAAHEARDEQGAPLGLVHRDVSPQNVIVGTDGVVRLIDFGIAKAAGRRNASRNGQLKGKLAYLAPEQLQRGRVDHRSDVYSAAVLLWELLTGEHLFDGDTEGMVLASVLDDDVPPPSSLRGDLPPGLDAIALRGLDRELDRRFASAREMARALEQSVLAAGADEVGAWVLSLAAASITARRELLARIERQAAADVEAAVVPTEPRALDAFAAPPPPPRGALARLAALFRPALTKPAP